MILIYFVGLICGYSQSKSGLVCESTRWEDDAIHLIEWWLQATIPGSTRPLKNRHIGYPRISASSLFPNLDANYRVQHAGGAGSSIQVG